MKHRIISIVALAALMLCATGLNAQVRQSIFLNGNIPTGQFGRSISKSPRTVPLYYTDIAKDASIGFGLGYRASYRFDIGMGMVAPFVNADFIWNTISGEWREKYSDAYMTTPTYFNIPLQLGVQYIYDELPWNDISAFGEFGVGTDLLWITHEGNGSGVPSIAYKGDFAFTWSLGAGAYLGRHFSAGLYYYGMGKHDIDYTKNTQKELNLGGGPLPRQHRTVGSIMLRLGFHF